MVLHSHYTQFTIFSHSPYFLSLWSSSYFHTPPFIGWFSKLGQMRCLYTLLVSPCEWTLGIVRNQRTFGEKIHITVPQRSPDNAVQLFYLPLVISTHTFRIFVTPFKLQLNVILFQSFFLLFHFRRNVSSFLLIYIPSYLISLNHWMCVYVSISVSHYLSLPLDFTILFIPIFFKCLHWIKRL